jgi:aryl-alcohol dehydrogenase-like predicted oxidoreductase
VEVHLRSVFLQGVAFLPAAELSTSLSPCFDTLRSIDEFSAARRVSAADVWFAYAQSLPVDQLVIGLETVLQLRQNAARLSSPPIDGVDRLAAVIPSLPAEAINPARWARG